MSDFYSLNHTYHTDPAKQVDISLFWLIQQNFQRNMFMEMSHGSQIINLRQLWRDQLAKRKWSKTKANGAVNGSLI